MAASQLAELGAEVIKIDNLKVVDSARGLGNAPLRGMASIYMQAGRGKQSICIDGRCEGGMEVIQKLVERADIVIQNFRPGGADRAGIGFEQCKSWNKDIIYCSSSGFGPEGPCADQRIYDMIIQVLSGFTSIQGSDADPKMASGFFFDKACALTCGQAILSALVARDRGAGGVHIQVSMLEAAIQLLWSDGYFNHIWTGMQQPLPPAPEIMEHLCPGQRGKGATELGIQISESVLLDPEYNRHLEKVKHYMFGTHWAGKASAVFGFSHTPLTPRPAAPHIGEHSLHILKALGYSPAEIDAFIEPASDKAKETTPGCRGRAQGVVPAILPFKSVPAIMKAPAMGALKAKGDEESLAKMAKIKGACDAKKAAIAKTEWVQGGACFGIKPAKTASPQPGFTKGPHTGTVVIDLTAGVAGGFGGMLLADQGARVIKVEIGPGDEAVRDSGPQAEPSMSATHMALHANKESLHFPDAKAAMEYFTASQAWFAQDRTVFLTSDTMEDLHPIASHFDGKSIRVHIKHGVGEVTLQQKSGMCGRQYKENESATLLQGDGKSMVQIMMCEKTAGFYAASAVNAALYCLGRGGAPQVVEIDMAASTMLNLMPDIFMCQSWISDKDGYPFPTETENRFTEKDAEAAAHFAKSEGNCRMSEIAEIFQPVQCKDGVWIFMIAISDAELADLKKTFPDFFTTPPALEFKCVEHRAGVRLEAEEVKRRLEGPWKDIGGRMKDLAATLELMRQLVKSVTYAEFAQAAADPSEARGGKDSVVYGKCNTREEVLRHPQVLYSKTLTEYDFSLQDGKKAKVRLPRPAARFVGMTEIGKATMAPRLGQHNAELGAK